MEIQLTSILFQAINFGVVLGALIYLLYKPILKLFEERSQRIAEGQKAAEEAIKGRERISVLEKSTKRKLEKEAAQVIERAVVEAEREKQRILDEAHDKAEEELNKLKSKWQIEKEQLKDQFHRDMVDAIIKVSQKIIGTHLADIKKQQQLIEQELERILKEL